MSDDLEEILDELERLLDDAILAKHRKPRLLGHPYRLPCCPRCSGARDQPNGALLCLACADVVIEHIAGMLERELAGAEAQ